MLLRVDKIKKNPERCECFKMLPDKVTVNSKSYASAMFTYSEKRKTVWGDISNYLNRHYIPKDSAVLELGSGYEDFIGQIKTREKVAIEIDDIHEERMPGLLP